MYRPWGKRWEGSLVLADRHLGRVDKRQGKEDFVATQAAVGQSFPRTTSPEMNSSSHGGLSGFFLPTAVSPSPFGRSGRSPEVGVLPGPWQGSFAHWGLIFLISSMTRG